jgi:hypothetical protein
MVRSGGTVRWRAREGLASTVLGLFIMVIVLLLGMGLFVYNQIAATRQTVTATVTAAVRAAVPASFQTEALATSTSTSAAGLQLSTAQFASALAHALPDFWAGATVQPCTTTPTGSPASCTGGASYLVTLPPATAAALDLAGPMVITNVQVLTGPGTLTHFGASIHVGQPTVAVDVAVPIRVQLGSLLHTTVWEQTGVTQALYADQGGPTAAGSRMLPYVPATPTATLCTEWAGPTVVPVSVDWAPSVLSVTVPCSTPPNWCPTGSLACRLVAVVGSTESSLGSIAVEYVMPSSLLGTSDPSTVIFPQADWSVITWQTPPAGSCWQGIMWAGTNPTLAERATPGTFGPCTTVPSNVPAWAQQFWYTRSDQWCYAGMATNVTMIDPSGTWPGGEENFVLCTQETPY